MGAKPYQPRPLNVLITGCTDGSIGSALAAEFHLRGCRVFPTVRDPSRAAHLVAATGIPADDIILLDVEDPATISAAARQVRRLIRDSLQSSPSSSSPSSNSHDDDDNEDNGEEEEPALDMLVNNAGIGYSATFLDSDLAAAKRLFDVNIWGVVAVTQAFAPLLLAAGRRSKSGGGGGGGVGARIVNIGSIFSDLTPPYTSFYSASKAALRALSDTMRVEMAPLGISVVHITAGVVATKIVASASVDFPPDSPYDSARAHMQEQMSGKILNDAMQYKRADARAFARDVVSHCLASPLWGGVGGGEYWCGFLSWTTWAITRFVPTWVRDAVIARFTGLDRVTVPSRYEVDMG